MSGGLRARGGEEQQDRQNADTSSHRGPPWEVVAPILAQPDPDDRGPMTTQIPRP